MGKRLGDAADPLLVSVRSGAPFSMPGMMDTVLNLGLNDVVGRRPRQADRQRAASPTTRTAASCRCSARSCSTSTASGSSRRSSELREQRGVATDPELSAEDLAGSRRRASRRSCSRRRASTSRRTPRSSCGYAIEAVFRSWNGERARDLPPHGEDPRRPRHRGQRADDGVRQQGRRLRHRRRVHPRPGHRREPSLRRLPRATPRARTSSPASASPSRSTRWANEFPECHTQLLEVMQHAPEPLPRHVRHRVHHRAGPPVPPADPRRQAHRGRRAAHGRRDGGGRPHRPARGGAARAAGAARPAPAPAVRPDGEVHGGHQGPQRVAGRRGRQGLLHRRLRRGSTTTTASA